VAKPRSATLGLKVRFTAISSLDVRAHVSVVKNLRQAGNGNRFNCSWLCEIRHSKISGEILNRGGQLVNQTRMRRTDLENVLTISEVAEVLRMHSTTIYRMVNRGVLPGFKIGGAWRINRATLDLWLSAEHLK
jgi:excisionase family DNA binding protein